MKKVNGLYAYCKRRHCTNIDCALFIKNAPFEEHIMYGDYQELDKNGECKNYERKDDVNRS